MAQLPLGSRFAARFAGLGLPEDIPDLSGQPVQAPELSDEDLNGAGLTAEEIARSPEIGAWSEEGEMQSGAEYVEKLRGARREPPAG